MSKDRKNCLCTAMLYDPKDHYEPQETKEAFEKKSKLYERLLRLKQTLFGKKETVNGSANGVSKPKSFFHFL
jgi:hypothetical protein